MNRSSHVVLAVMAYLWLGPLLMLLTRGLFGLGGLPLVAAAGVLHILLLLRAASFVVARGAPAEEGWRVTLPALLLLAGPALFILGASTGPPSPLQPAAYLFNTVGLLAGSLVSAGGLLVLAARLWAARERSSAALISGGVILAAGLWLPSLALRIALLSADSWQAWAAEQQVYQHLYAANLPEQDGLLTWRGFLLVWTFILGTLHKALLLSCTAGACFALSRCRMLGTTGSRCLGAVCLALALLVPLGRLGIEVGVLQRLWTAAAIPFVPYALLYFLAVALLAHVKTRRARPLLADFAPAAGHPTQLR